MPPVVCYLPVKCYLPAVCYLTLMCYLPEVANYLSYAVVLPWECYCTYQWCATFPVVVSCLVLKYAPPILYCTSYGMLRDAVGRYLS